MFGSGDFYTSSQGGQNITNLAQSPQAGKQARRQEDKMSCLPVTVRTVESALAAGPAESGELRFFGQEHGMLVLVAFAESVVSQHSSVELSVNDATGRINVRHYMVEKSDEIDQIKPGCYLTLVGQVRTAPEPHFAANSIHMVKSADEVSYHMIEAAHAALKLQKGRGDDPMTPAPKRSLPFTAAADAMPVDTPTKMLPGQTAEEAAAVPVAQASAPPAAVKGPLSGDALRQAIMAHIQREGEGKQEGLSLDSICSHLAGTGADAVQGALTQLVEDGDLYNPLDDQHFAVL